MLTRFCDIVNKVNNSISYLRYGVNKLEAALNPLVKGGLKTVLIFGVPTKAKKVNIYYEGH